MRFNSISQKQAEIFRFPHENYDALICDGAVRSGKTVMMVTSFLEWAMNEFDGCNFAVCGKTVRAAERNIIMPLLSIRSITRKYDISYTRSVSLMTVKRHGRVNYFYVFGGKDESSYMLIQGITLAGVLFDEVALMPQSFVEQAIARTLSVAEAKLWFNCNPENPMHWFYTEWIQQPEKHNAKHIHFLMDDNPGLSEEAKTRAKASFSGVFYRRYVLGEWCAAEGAVYDMFNDACLFDELPINMEHRIYRRYIAIDYGTINPCVFLEIIDDCQGNYFLTRERYYDSKKEGRQKADDEHADDLEKFIVRDSLRGIIIDPSAASFKLAIRKKGFRTIDADNDVLDGIRLVSTLLAQGRLHVHKDCINTRKEFAAYVWNDKRSEKGIEEPLKQNDHAMDALRYFVKTIVGGYRSVKKE